MMDELTKCYLLYESAKEWYLHDYWQRASDIAFNTPIGSRPAALKHLSRRMAAVENARNALAEAEIHDLIMHYKYSCPPLLRHDLF